MDLLKAVILGIVQGATEFLPVSSSAHLVLVPWWLGWDEPPLVFDVALHMGTLMAVLVYFWRDWLTFLRAGLNALRTRSIQDPDARLLLLLVIATIPAAVAGFFLEGPVSKVFSDPPLTAALLLVTAALLFFSERHYTADRALSVLTLRDALFVGFAQAVSILPGVSRSGSTMAAGITRGLSRSSAARFSFLLGTPIIFGAGLKSGLDIATGKAAVGHDMIVPMLAGLTAAAVVGFGCIWFLMRLLQQRRLYGFAVYCAVFGTLSLLVALLI